MAAKARCRCGTVLRVPCGRAGHKTRCPSCHALIRVQKPSRKRQQSEQAVKAVTTPVPGNTLLSMAMQEIGDNPEVPSPPAPPLPDVPVVQVDPVPDPPTSSSGPVLQLWPVCLATVVAVAIIVVVIMLVSRS